MSLKSLFDSKSKLKYYFLGLGVGLAIGILIGSIMKWMIKILELL